MFPTLIKGNFVLVDHAQIGPTEGKIIVSIFVQRNTEVKRSGGVTNGQLLLRSDNPNVKDRT